MSAARLLLSALLVLLCGAHSGCKSSSSSPTKPEPEVERGTVTLLHNGSGFSASVRAAECVQTEQLQIEADDFTDADFVVEIQCSAEAQGEGHSGRVDAEALLRFLYDGPDGQISEIRFRFPGAIESFRDGVGERGSLLLRAAPFRGHR
jgi:hypothetical protein